MSSTMRRLSSGDTIHIRTGVLQGIGPQGPRGATGAQGPRGYTGPQGMPGPTGYVNESSVMATGSGTLGTAATTMASFSNVLNDDAGVYSSATTFSVHTGSWSGTVWVRFKKRTGINGSGYRRVEVTLDGTVVAAATTAAAADDNDVSLPVAFKASTGGDVQVQIYQNDGGTMSYESRIFLARIGAGLRGPEGPAGPTGPPGPTGASGPQGPSGSLASNTTFADIGGS